MLLLGDRILVLEPTRAIDLATGEAVRCDRVICASEREARAWLDRGARRLAWWHSHLPAWIDVVPIPDRTILVVRDEHARCPGTGADARRALSWLRERDVDTALDHALDAAAPTSATAGASARSRAIGLELSAPPLVERLADLVDAPHGITQCVDIEAPAGAGVSTCFRLLARETRLRGACPLAPAALARHPYLTRLLAGRTVVLLRDREPGHAALDALWSALITLRCAGIAVPLVVTAGALPTGVARAALASFGASLADRLTLWPPLPPSRRRDLVRRADGLPGSLMARWLRDRRVPHARPWRIGRDAVVLARDTGQGWAPASTVSAWRSHWRLLERGYAARAHRAFVRALGAAAGRPFDVWQIVEGLRGAGEAALACGRPELAVRDLDLARLLAGQHGLERHEHCARAAQVRAWLAQGRANCAGRVPPATLAMPVDSAPRAAVALANGALAAATGDLSSAWSFWAGLTKPDHPNDVRAAALLDVARLRLLTGDVHGAREAWQQSVPAVRSSRRRELWWRIRLTRLAMEQSRGPRGNRQHIARDRARLARGDVPPFVRLLAQYVMGGARGGREVARFVERWGEGALRGLGSPIQVARAGETRMIRDLQAILEICRDADDSRTAVAETVTRVRLRLDAATVLLHAVPSGQRLAGAGVDRGESWRLAAHALECGGSVPAQDPSDGLPCAAANVRFAGQLLGILVCRWPFGTAPERRDADLLLAGAATAMAPHVHVLQDLATRERAAACDTFGLLGASPAVCHLRDRIRRVAAAPFHVLIEGESGSGKELVARALHASGPRHGRRFCAVNCAALTDELLEAELFGHARGAFTGAVGDRAGLFEEADGGTLFLDEVGELSLRAQAKLLRAIQDGEVRRVGETFARRAEARIVAATNRTLSDEVAAGRFRADLLYRLDVIRIAVPPLRDRPDDVVIIAKACWREATERLGSRAQLHPATLAALARYDWPGNVRELQNVIRALAVNAPGRGFVRPAALPAAIVSTSGAPVLTLDAARRGFEERFVRAALARAGQRPSQAARDLGLSRQGLRKLIQRLGIAGQPLADVPQRR